MKTWTRDKIIAYVAEFTGENELSSTNFKNWFLRISAAIFFALFRAANSNSIIGCHFCLCSFRASESELYLLNEEPHRHVEACEAARVRYETFVKSQRAALFDGRLDHIERALVSAGLIHMSCRQHVKRRAKNAGRETSASCTCQMARYAILHEAPRDDSLFVMIVAGNLSCADDTVAKDVRRPTSPQSRDALLGNNFTVAIHRACVLGCSCFARVATQGRLALILQAHLDHVRRVRHSDTNGASAHGCNDFLP